MNNVEYVLLLDYSDFDISMSTSDEFVSIGYFKFYNNFCSIFL